MDSPTAQNIGLDHRLRQGNEQALAELFSENRERLWRTVRFRIHDRLRGRVDPDDILQEGYLAAAQRLDHYVKASMSPFLWLRAVVLQTLTDVHRAHLGTMKRDARREVRIHSRPYPQATSISMAVHLVGSLTSPSGVAARQETVDRVRRAIEEMDAVDQEVLALRHFEEMTNREAAELLGLKPAAASNRYMRALKRLQSVLSAIMEP